MEAELQQRMEALTEAERRHGSIEERMQQLEAKVQEKDSELQRVNVSFLQKSDLNFKSLSGLLFS